MLQLHRRLFHGALSLIFLGILSIRPVMAQNADSFIVIDAGSGRVLNAMNPEMHLYPASMTKIMTLFMTFEALSQGRLSLRTQLPVSELAATQAPSKLGLRPGSTISVENCIYAAVTLSANDCAMVLAEGIGGSEAQFARMMTSRAQSLGMVNTHYNNPNGLPDEGQITTARDMATLAEALIQRFPKYYPYFATRVFTYNGIPHANHNHLMSRYAGMDGIKTGFIRASGFNLTASAVRQGHRLIAVVFGGSSAVSRDNYMAGLLDDGFRRIAGQPAPSEMRADPALTASAAPVPPAKFVNVGQLPNQTAVIASAGQVAGVALSEAGDDVEANESEAPGASAAPIGPVVGETKTVAMAPVISAQQSDPIGAEAAAATQTVPAALAPPLAPQQARTPVQPEPEMAEGDAEFPEPRHVLRVPVTRAGMIRPTVTHKPVQWHVQLGIYTSKAVSDAILQKAVASLPSPLRSAAKPESIALRVHNRRVYRATIAGLDQAGAKRACSALAHCMPVKSS